MSEPEGEAARKDAAEDEEESDLRSRFPDVEKDTRLRTPRGEALPGVPEAKYERPKPPPDPALRGGGISPLSPDLRGMGEASTIGITLVASIAIGTGLGWLVDTFLLKSGGTPWGLIAGFFLGVASGFVNLVRVANRLNKDK